MKNDFRNLEELLGKATSPSVPKGLEQRVLLAVYNEKRHEEAFSRRFWVISVVVSVSAIAIGLMASWQSLNASGLLEIAQTALANLNNLRVSDVLWGLVESLPLGSLALTFCAATIFGWLASLKKQERQHLLSLKFI